MPVLLYLVSLLLAAICTTGPAAAAETGDDQDGQVQWEYLYQDGQLREVKWYDEQGRTRARTVFSHNRPVLTEGYRHDGSLEWLLRELAAGRQEATRFGTGRNIELRYEIAEDQFDGPSTVFAANGQPRQTVTFRMGTLHGPARTFHENGRAESEYTYRDGLLDGPCRYYSPEGRLTAEQSFAMGQIR